MYGHSGACGIAKVSVKFLRQHQTSICLVIRETKGAGSLNKTVMVSRASGFLFFSKLVFSARPSPKISDKLNSDAQSTAKGHLLARHGLCKCNVLSGIEGVRCRRTMRSYIDPMTSDWCPAPEA